MYPSDYGYATSNRACLTKNMNSVETWSSDCFNNDWLNINNFQWTLTPYATSNNGAFGVFSVRISGIVISNQAFYADLIFPTIFLKTNVKVGMGDGSLDFPYELIV